MTQRRCGVSSVTLDLCNISGHATHLRRVISPSFFLLYVLSCFMLLVLSGCAPVTPAPLGLIAHHHRSPEQGNKLDFSCLFPQISHPVTDDKQLQGLSKNNRRISRFWTRQQQHVTLSLFIKHNKSFSSEGFCVSPTVEDMWATRLHSVASARWGFIQPCTESCACTEVHAQRAAWLCVDLWPADDPVWSSCGTDVRTLTLNTLVHHRCMC